MKECYKNLSVLLITIFLCLLMFEGFLRVANPHYLQPFQTEGKIFESDSELGIKLIPNSTGTITYYGWGHQIGEVVTYNINSKGIRDEEYEYNKPENITRVILLGDSFTFGAEVNEKDRIDKNMETLLNNYQIINMGVSAYGTIQEFLLLKSESIKYNPDTVYTFLFVANDGIDNIGSGPQAESIEYAKRPIIQNGEIVYPTYIEKIEENKSTPLSQRIEYTKGKLREHSFVYAFISEIYHRKVKLDLGIIGSGYKLDNPNIEYNRQIFDTITALKMIDIFCDEHNIEHKVVIIPPGSLVNDGYSEWEGEEHINYVIKFKKDIIKCLTLFNINYIDLTPYLKEESTYLGKVYFNTNGNPGHFTPYGNKIVAEILVNELEN